MNLTIHRHRGEGSGAESLKLNTVRGSSITMKDNASGPEPGVPILSRILSGRKPQRVTLKKSMDFDTGSKSFQTIQTNTNKARVLSANQTNGRNLTSKVRRLHLKGDQKARPVTSGNRKPQVVVMSSQYQLNRDIISRDQESNNIQIQLNEETSNGSTTARLMNVEREGIFNVNQQKIIIQQE